ncbi:MAG TPA: Mur ligase domain-containing protein [Candidatus Dormibacteraeota bacterium]|jgi:UDP-N-acetylmuramate--L-alanine ligase|nr:Mur ligase domain-containing protein [Candidatus Dormibacteraeota bacterium]
MSAVATRHVHFLGICGYAVSGAALVAKQLGYTVTGSDEDAYPPTTDTLTAAGIPWVNHHAPGNLDMGGSAPDLVVVGNQVRPGNPEWEEAVRRGLAVTSEAEFYGELTRDRVRIAVCGTHGKTTTSSLLAWMLESAGMSPGFRLGTTSRDFGATARLGAGGPFVFEGDEYTTAPWDSRPKFLHTHPFAACVTRLELDHPDVYPTFDAYRAPFVELAGSMPREGVLALCADDPECVALAAYASCRVVTYGAAPDADWHVDDAGLQSFTIARRDGVAMPQVALSMPGWHNALNATAALILADAVGAPLDACIAACATFKGASRRFEVLGTAGGVTVVDDYAHHPTEVGATVQAAVQRFPGARLFVVYVPHTFSRTLALLDDYAGSFRGASTVLLGAIEPARERHLAHTVSSSDIAARVQGVADVRVVGGSDEALAIVLAEARPGDAVLCLSVRGFDDLAKRVMHALAERPGAD